MDDRSVVRMAAMSGSQMVGHWAGRLDIHWADQLVGLLVGPMVGSMDEQMVVRLGRKMVVYLADQMGSRWDFVTAESSAGKMVRTKAEQLVGSKVELMESKKVAL